MKYFIFFLFFTTPLFALAYYSLDRTPIPSTSGYTSTTYYVSSTGNDGNIGTSENSAWKTLTKVNSWTFKAGDNILFRKGDTFYGTIRCKNSGTSAAPITFSAYGSGDAPVLTGFTILSGWANEGGGIYSKVISSESQTNMVTIDGVNTAMGRFPNRDYLTYESASTNISITDNELSDSPNWTGAEVVIRKNDWTLDRCPITNHTGNSLTYARLGTNLNGTAGYGFFFQNDLQTLDRYGEWFHDTGTGKFYMYFGATDPSIKVVKVATLNNLMYSNGGEFDYINLENISFEGSIKSNVNIVGYYSDGMAVRNCTVNFSGEYGIYLGGCRNSIIENNVINNSAMASINIIQGGGSIVTNNKITNSGIILGQALEGTKSDGIFFLTDTDINYPQYGLIQYNTIDSSGYNGIYAEGNNLEVKNNYINHSMMLLNDGGGIYTTGKAYTGRIIEGNIVLNSIGDIKGTIRNSSMAEGIYLDESASGVEVTDNTIAGCLNSGVKFHKADNITLLNNTIFNNAVGLDIENWTGVPLIRRNIMKGNIFFAKNASQLTLKIWGNANDNKLFGIADNNHYVRPIDDTNVIYTSQLSTGEVYRTLSDWQAYSGQDANSKNSPVTISSKDDLIFEYNASKKPKIITLKYPMIDIMCNEYSDRIILQPYSSAILIKTN